MARASANQHTKPTRPLAAALAAFGDEQLAALLTARPDLARPRPANFEQLAARASSWPSILACFDTLDRTHRQLLEAMCLAPKPTCSHLLASYIDGSLDPEDLAGPLTRLESLALIQVEDGHHVWLNPGFTSLRFPAGLGPPASSLLQGFPASFLTGVAERLGIRPERAKGATMKALASALRDPELVRRTIAAGPPGTAELAERLAAGPPVMSVAGSYYNATDRTPPGWLINRGLLVHPGWGEAFMPGEVGLAMRDTVLLPGFSLHPPSPVTSAVDLVFVDAAAAGAALRLVADMASLLDEWGTVSPKVLKSGGIGVRDVRRVAAAAGRSEADAARLIELAVLAGLAGPDRSGEVVLPTARFDEWLGTEPGPRWAALVDAWLGGGHHLSAALDPPAGGGTARPLLPRFSARARDQRRAVLDALAELPVGRSADQPGLAAAVTWPLPALWGGSLAASSAAPVGAVLAEAELLGVAAGCCLSGPGRLAAGGRVADAGRALSELAPAMVSDFTVQADLTAVAAGTLAAAVRAELDLLADVESTGSAIVFRFSPSSLVRAFEAGRTSDQISGWLAAHARNQVPQPLSYLVGDLGRRYGRLRVGAAATYLRCDDPSLTAEVLRARAAATLKLQELAPGVLISRAKPDQVMNVLRAAGYLPAQEAADGTLVICRPEPARAPAPPPATAAAAGGRGPARPGGAAATTDVIGVVAALRQAAAPLPVQPSLDPELEELLAMLADNGVDVDDFLEDVGRDVPPRPTGIVKDPDGIWNLLELALDGDWGVRLDYTNGKGQQRQLSVVLVEIDDDDKVKVLEMGSGVRQTLAVDRIHWARVMTEAEEEAML